MRQAFATLAAAAALLATACSNDMEQLRAAVLHSGQPDLMAAWTRTASGADDYEVWVRQRDLLPPGSPLWAIAVGQLARLDHEYGA